jgi:sialate O-acetylesterase
MKSKFWAIVAVVAAGLILTGCRTGLPPETMSGSFALHQVFGSHMVLQRAKPVRISGTAEVGKVVKAQFAGKTVYAEADKAGEWEAAFPALKAGGPYMLKVSGQDGVKPIVLDDILVGEVWICSGQSNMQMPVMGGQFWRAANAEVEVENAKYPKIRLYNVPRAKSPGFIQKEIKGPGWTACTPESVKDFSAAGYFFGRQLYRDLGIPIGLIHSSWGGTRIEPWISEEAYLAADRREAQLVKAARDGSAEQAAKLKKANEEYQVKFNHWLAAFFNSNPAASAEAAQWKNVSYDDSAWEKAELSNGMPSEVDGVAWFRRRVDIPAGWAGKDLTLNLGAVDDCDETFVNGVKIGETGAEQAGYWAKNRSYTVPGKLVKAGRNVIAIRVADHYGNGGLMGNEKSMYLTLKEEKATRLAISRDWKFRLEFAADLKKLGPRPTTAAMMSGGVNSPSYPSTLFNSMIAPWTKYPLRGAIWYQGCSNAGSKDYYPLHKILINDWRTQWRDPEMPFLLVQLSAYEKHTPKKRLADDYWTKLAPVDKVRFALTREIQAEMLNLPNVGMAVSMDVGDHSDIHPRDKQTLGYRLAKEAERIAYGSGQVSQGPLYKAMSIEGSKIRLSFDNVGKGLATKDGQKPGAFAIAGADGHYVWAEAVIEHDTVLVSSPLVQQPKHVRYAWVQYRGDINLCNKDGFAASPFRTDKPEYK